MTVNEYLTYQEIVNISREKDFRQLAPLVSAYSAKFKTGKFVLDAKNRVAELRKELAINARNKEIQILSNFEKKIPFMMLLNTLKAKLFT